MAKQIERCWWCGDDELYLRYHDEEWGVPVHDERGLFEFLCLEGAQAGLSWITILRKRDNYRRAFDDFDAHKIARYGDKKIQALLQDTGIVRNRLKVNGFVRNARAYLQLLDEGTTLDAYLWDFVGGETLQNRRKSMTEVPATSAESDAMAKALKKRGFTFVGSTICYAFMQAAGLVNDHVVGCYRHRELTRG
ncbi:MAG TPA: DNA-3-methyladenine glycosylase I [Gammaproteobacteria bacterium]|nr:DNA-3-methyladenine glycosylase I [Gammaproteobacteria bacterium]